MGKWKNVILKAEDTIQSAIQALVSSGLMIVLVVGENENLLGTVTDGDIRRALMKHCGMETPLYMVMCNDPTTAHVDDDRDKILSLLKKKKILQIPIVDSQHKVVGLETLHNLLKEQKIDNPVFLMAGGFGKRLRPLTNDIPKPLLNVGNRPILETILCQFIDSGFHNFFISTHYKAQMVREHFGDGSQWNVNIQYIHEEKPLGTAGALGLLPKNLIELPIMMMNGDLLTQVNFKGLLNFHVEQGGVATMCVREYDFQVPYGVVESESLKITSIVEKPVHKFFVNAGIYVISSSLAGCVDGENYFDMPNLLQSRIDKGEQVNMFPVHEYWLDIGRIEEYNRANQEIVSFRNY